MLPLRVAQAIIRTTAGAAADLLFGKAEDWHHVSITGRDSGCSCGCPNSRGTVPSELPVRLGHPEQLAFRLE